MNTFDLLPRLQGRRLDGRALQLPDGLERPTLLLVAYRQWQQRQVNTWLDLADELQAAGADHLEVPLLSRRWLAGRASIDGGMASRMDGFTRSHTMTVYGNPGAFRRALRLPVNRIGVLLTAPSGEIRWRTTGACDVAGTAGLREALAESGRVG